MGAADFSVSFTKFNRITLLCHQSVWAMLKCNARNFEPPFIQLSVDGTDHFHSD